MTPQGNRGLSTAGHCPNLYVTYRGVTLNYKQQAFSHSADVQWHDNPDVTWGAVFFDGYDMREVNSLRTYAGMVVGDVVCKRGKVTNYGCGVIADRTVCPSYVSSCDPTFIRVHDSDGENLCDEGDSGGPVFMVNSADGLISGQWRSGGSGVFRDCIVMPQGFMSALGIRVLTKAP